MNVTVNNGLFNLGTQENIFARIKFSEENFDDILSLFLDLSDKEKKKIRKIRFE
jgi:hypothetical protein